MNLLEMNIDKTVPVPLYYQLKSLILSEIKKKGNLKRGRLSPYRNANGGTLSRKPFNCSSAISNLSKEG